MRTGLALALALTLSTRANAVTLVVNGLLGTDATATAPATAGGNAVAAVGDAADATNTITARGGRGGHDLVNGAADAPGRGGDARAEVTASSPADLSAVVSAQGGSGGSGQVRVGRGGDAWAAGTATNETAARITLTVEARAGSNPGGRHGEGGVAALGPVYGASTGGGDVTVTGRLVQGNADIRLLPPIDGRDAFLWNAVDGDTTGALSLTQEARAGSTDGGIAAEAVRGGHATSHLEKVTWSESLALNALAFGGGSGTQVPGPPLSVGGDATATARGTNHGGSLAVATTSQAGGGNRPSAGRGGEARSLAYGVGAGDVTISGSARGGGGGDPSGANPPGSGPAAGGRARSESIGVAITDGGVHVTDSAIGGNSGRFSPNVVFPFAPDAGDATSMAWAIALGRGDAFAQSTALGGSGGWSDLAVDHPAAGGGQGRAQAIAVALDGDATAVVEQTGGAGGRTANGRSGRGGDSILENAASGYASGTLRLEQHALAGDGGPGSGTSTSTGRPGDGGDAVSRLSATNHGGGDLELFLRAIGGDVPSIQPDDTGRAGDASVSAEAWCEDDSNVSIDAFAEAGDAGSGEVAGGQVHFDNVHGRSDGGNVRVWAQGYAGSATLVRGQDIEMIDVTTGETSGSLDLRQAAQAGGGNGGGNALSALTYRVRAQSLNAWVEAIGGTSRTNAASGNAFVQSDLVSDGGDVRLIPLARGGWSGPEGRAGDANVEARAQAPGRVTVGAPTQGAFGGNSDTAPGSRAGNATSRSIGVTTGDAFVTVRDYATGGNGRGDGLVSDPTRGGSARSEAIARGGSLQVVGRAEAIGGNGGGSLNTNLFRGGPGGDAVARARAQGRGDVSASAVAQGGSGLSREAHWTVQSAPLAPLDWYPYFGWDGDAFAQAEAAGASGSFGATARTGGSIAGHIDVQTAGEVRGGIERAIASRATWRQGFAEIPSGADGYAAASLRAKLPEGALAERGARHFVEERSDEVIAVGSMGAFIDAPSEEPIEFHQFIELQFYSFVEVGTADLFLEILAPELGVSAFESLAFEVWNGGTNVFELETRDVNLALEAMTGLVLDVGNIRAPVLDPSYPSYPYYSYAHPFVTLRMTVTLSEAGSGFGFDFAIGHAGAPVVPEPPRLLAFLLAIAGLARAGRGPRPVC